MASLARVTAASAASVYEQWHRHFLGNRHGFPSLPWNNPYRLSADEIRLVGGAIQQFQLGEWARGRGFRRRAATHPVLGRDPWFLPALELFIAEEQGHSQILGRFLDREGIPRLESHWVDGIFRRLRKLAGLEVCAMVLVTAEVLAMPFYQALRDATRSDLLRSIAVRILCDEAAHLRYQALTLGLIRRPLGEMARAIRSLGHRMLFLAAACTLWQQHGRVFRAAGWRFRRFWKESWRGFAHLELQIQKVSLVRLCDGCFDQQRLD